MLRSATVPKEVILVAKILVVEEDDAVRKMVSKILRQVNYIVESLPDGQPGAIALMMENFDLVVTDWKMSNWDGDDMLMFVSMKDVDLPPVIAMTGSDIKECEQAFRVCLPAGHYLVCIYKPDVPEVLLAEVEKALSSG